MAGPNSFGMEVELEESVAKSAEQAERRLVAPLAPRPFSLNGKDQSLQLSFTNTNTLGNDSRLGPLAVLGALPLDALVRVRREVAPAEAQAAQPTDSACSSKR